MAIRLKVIGGKAASTGRRGSAVFGVHGGRIGRAPDNDWVLTDPDRYVSSHHAVIQHNAGEWWITDLSRNGTYLNEARSALGSGGRRQLANGDLLRIGDYEILVEITPSNDFPPDSPISDADFIETRIDFDSDDLPVLDTSGIRASDVYGQERGGRGLPAGAERDRRRERSDAPVALRGEDRELWPGILALCRGAGLEPAELSADARAALLHQAGQLLREIAVGFHELAQARAEFTRDFGILPASAKREGSGPNPRPIHVDEALREWLGSGGGKGLVDAARQNFAEARRHELAVATAVKEAVNDMLVHIDPDELELQFGRGTRTPGDAGAFARYWQRYRELFRTFAQPAESGMPAAFAEEFGRAYRRLAALGGEPRDGDSTAGR